MYEHVRPAEACHTRPLYARGRHNAPLRFRHPLSFFFLSPALEQSVSATVTVATSTAPNAFAHVPLEAKAVIVYDLATGETLYAKDADAQLPLASLTKLLTVYAALIELSPDTPITIPASVVSIDGPRIFL